MQYTDEAISLRKSKISKIKKNIKKVIYVFLIPLLIYNISLIVQAVLRPNQTPAFFGYKMYVIISGSMEPELYVGDIAVVKALKKDEKINKDDVISFRQGQTVITHRVKEIINVNGIDKYKTKGDNNNSEDIILIDRNAIEGKMVGKIKSLGNTVLALKNTTLIIVIVLFYYIFLMCDQRKQNTKAIRKIKREEYEEQKKEEKISDKQD